MQSDSYLNVIDEIDRLNSQDPNIERVEGNDVAKELLYSQRMSAMLDEFEPKASESLRIATRAQHIQRWTIPRDSYSMDRKGYLVWRTELKKFHGNLTGTLMRKVGYSYEEIQRVDDLINKRRLKSDSETQTLEDVICLVFLKYYFDDFIEKHAQEPEKIIDIIQKTWRKMSDKGHVAALDLPHSEKALRLITQALG